MLEGVKNLVASVKNLRPGRKPEGGDEPVRQFTEQELARADRIIPIMSKVNATVFRLTNGRLGATFIGGAPVGVLHHTGAKSGAAYETPLIVLEDDPNVVVVASKAGMPQHPAWYFNLTANPDCRMHLKGQPIRDVRARLASDGEREVLWPRLDAIYGDFAEYRARADLVDRRIELFVLEPR